MLLNSSAQSLEKLSSISVKRRRFYLHFRVMVEAKIGAKKKVGYRFKIRLFSLRKQVKFEGTDVLEGMLRVSSRPKLSESPPISRCGSSLDGGNGFSPARNGPCLDVLGITPDSVACSATARNVVS
ncbi:hypothetical protein TNCV_3357601 [Trichonephila clavipes]|nr:hypothetical protein TNCV_3357601 [Trichonephila clavipes]